MGTLEGEVAATESVTTQSSTVRTSTESSSTEFLDLPNELLHKIFVRIPFDSNQLCKLMLVNGQIREYITENKAQILNDIAEVQFAEQTLTYSVANHAAVGRESVEGVSEECLIDLAKSDNHVKFVFEKMKSMMKPESNDSLTPSVLLTCLHIFEGLHRVDLNVDLELESTLFVTMLRSILPRLRLTSMKVSEALHKHLRHEYAIPAINFFSIAGVELACENVMVKHGLGPIVSKLNLSKAEYSEKGESAQADLAMETQKVSKTRNMMCSYAVHYVPDFIAPLSVLRPMQSTEQATWGSIATAALVLKYFSGDIMGLDRKEPLKEGFTRLMQRCDAFPNRIETSSQEQEHAPPSSLLAVAGEAWCMEEALEYDWAGFAARGVKDELAKPDKQMDGGYKMLRAALGPLALVSRLKVVGLSDVAAQVSASSPHVGFLASEPFFNSLLDGIEKEMAERKAAS